MKALKNKSSRLSIEVFNPALLKETDLWSFDDYSGNQDDDMDDQDNGGSGLDELSLEEFQKTL